MSNVFLDAIHADPWSEQLVDLPSLNAATSNAIEAAAHQMRERARSEPTSLRSSSLVVLGPPGAGKTHLFARLRKRLGPRAVFIHLRPLVHAPITPDFLLSEIVRQLGYQSLNLPQIDALVGSLLAQLSGVSSDFPNLFLDEYRRMTPEERQERLDSALEQVLGIWQETEETFLARLLQVPFAKPLEQRALLAWLSGRDCDANQLARIGATRSLDPALSIAALRTLSAVSALGAPLVLVFDQLENLVERIGSARVLEYANVVAELVDTARGMVIVQLALESEWVRAIEPAFNLSQASRLTMHRALLALPSPNERRDLLRLWYERLEEREAAFPWPLNEAQLDQLVAIPGVTPRMLLSAFRSALAGEVPDLLRDVTAVTSSTAPIDAPLETLSQALEEEWRSRVTSARQAIDAADAARTGVDTGRICDGFLALGAALPARALHATNDSLTQLGFSGPDKNLLAVVGQSHPRTVSAALTKLLPLARRAPVAVVREYWREFPPTWKETLNRRDALLATGNVRWIQLERQDLANLLALDSLLQAARSRDVTDGQGRPLEEATIIAFVQQELSAETWPIARELSGETVAVAPLPDTVSPSQIAAGETAIQAAKGSVDTPASAVLLVLRQLRVASVERLVREVIRLQPTQTRSSVLAQLEAPASKVVWFGRSIVALRGDHE